jgi:pimeloyl-ACP methyl ester carboxylesterase
VAWHSALLRPDRFRAVIGLSVPYRGRGPARPTSGMPQTDAALFYQLYFQTPGVAEAELERDPKTTIRRMLYGASGDVAAGSGGAWQAGSSVGMVDRKAGMLAGMPEPPHLPPWLTAADLDYYAAEFARTGFRGGLNWYRNIDRSWELLAPYAGAKVTVPALYVAGDRDLVVKFPGAEQVLANLPNTVRSSASTSCSGLWPLDQQERAREVNEAMIGFLKSL